LERTGERRIAKADRWIHSVDQDDDDLAIVAAAQRDRNAFAPLYERYHRSIYIYCYRRLANPEAAEDAASLVFVKAITGLPRFRPDPRRQGSTFRSWLFSIAHNVIVDAWRKQRPDASLEQEAGARFAPSLVDPAERPEEMAIRQEEARMVMALLAQLPDRQRASVELRLAGLKTAEVADALGMSFGAAKAMQFRAYRRLRALLAANPHAITCEVPM
jgi:RNA polymerase sigma-70 factor (ECF subfamily)